MKNLTHKLLILLYFIGFISSAQPSPKKKAQKITNEITKNITIFDKIVVLKAYFFIFG